jgi:hypothetical protein
MANRISMATQPLVLAGTVVPLTAPTVDGDVVDIGAIILMVANGSGASITVTVRSTKTVQGLTVSNNIVTVAAGTTKAIPIPGGLFEQPAGANASGGNDQNRAYVDYSSITSVTRGVVSG